MTAIVWLRSEFGVRSSELKPELRTPNSQLRTDLFVKQLPDRVVPGLLGVVDPVVILVALGAVVAGVPGGAVAVGAQLLLRHQHVLGLCAVRRRVAFGARQHAVALV